MAKEKNAQDIGDVRRPLHEAMQIAYNILQRKCDGEKTLIPYLMGTPGGGKTEMAKAYAEKKGYNFLAFSPALERLEKFGGIPDIVKNDDGTISTKWTAPEMIDKINEVACNGNPTMVLLDDWHLCDESIQQIGFELFTYYSLNNHAVPENVMFMLAGNETSAAGARIQLSAIRNRCFVIKVDSDIEYWKENYAVPNNLHPTAVSFFDFPEHQAYFHEQEATGHQFGSPRSWTGMFKVLEGIEQDKDIKMTMGLLTAIAQGCVSKAAASRFVTYYDLIRNVDLKKIFDMDVIEIPTNPLEKFAYANAVCIEMYSRFTKKDLKVREKSAKTFAKVLSDIKDKEISTMMVNQIVIKTVNEHLKKDKTRDALSGREVIMECVKKSWIPAATVQNLLKQKHILRAE